MINNPPPFKGLNDIRIPIITQIKGRGFINQGSTLNRKSLVGWICEMATIDFLF